MKKGLVSPDQTAYGQIIYPNKIVQTDALGPLIIQVVPINAEFGVGEPFYWVDVPDEAVGGDYYYDTTSSTALPIGTRLCYATQNIVYPNPGGVGETQYAELGNLVIVSPAIAPVPQYCTAEIPSLGGVEQTLYWFNNDWIWSYFDPNQYNTVPEAKAILTTETYQYGALAVNIQSSIYSIPQLIDGDLTTLPTKDYPGYTITSYQTFIDGEIVAQIATIDSCTTLDQLFAINPASLDTNPIP
jgi:hypothetical protein